MGSTYFQRSGVLIHCLRTGHRFQGNAVGARQKNRVKVYGQYEIIGGRTGQDTVEE